jgi:hypothetical protein
LLLCVTDTDAHDLPSSAHIDSNDVIMIYIFSLALVPSPRTYGGPRQDKVGDKVRLMKLKSTAVGDSAINAADRIYVSVQCAPPPSPPQSVFISAKHPLGKVSSAKFATFHHVTLGRALTAWWRGLGYPDIGLPKACSSTGCMVPMTVHCFPHQPSPEMPTCTREGRSSSARPTSSACLPLVCIVSDCCEDLSHATHHLGL